MTRHDIQTRTFLCSTSACFASFCLALASCILSQTSSYSYTVSSTFFSASILFLVALDTESKFCASNCLFTETAAVWSSESVGAASMGSSSSNDEKAAGRLSGGAAPTGFALLDGSAKESFILPLRNDKHVTSENSSRQHAKWI